MKKRILACLLTVAMLASMTACTGGGDSSSTTDSSSSTESSSTEGSSSETGEVSPCGDPSHVWDAATPYEETITYTKGANKPSAGENFPEGDDYANNDFTRYCKEQVNTQHSKILRLHCAGSCF